MALTLKKKSDSSVSEVPPWHPDIRIVSSLPDTKVVRTAFFVNGGFALVAAVLLIWFAVDEWKLHEVNKEIDDWQHQIDQNQKQSAEAVHTYKDFKLEQAKTDEVADFMASRPVLSNIILRLGAITPKKIALDSLDFRETGLSIRATVKGAPDRSSGDVTAYEKQLKADKVLSPLFASVDAQNVTKNTQTGRLMFEILCTYKKPEGKKS
jgi:Tfp pilus assembly protein PilN